MARQFFVTIVRGKRVGILAGPFASEPAARARLDDARRVACAVDPWAHFDSFGTAAMATDRKGALNARLGL